MPPVSRSSVQRNRIEGEIHARLQTLDLEAQIREIEDDLEEPTIVDAAPPVQENVEGVGTPAGSGRAQPSRFDADGFITDIAHLRAALIHNSLTFTLSGRNLRFVHPPASSGPYERYVVGSEQSYNSGRCALHPTDSSNRQFLAYHTWLIVVHQSFPSPPAEVTEDIRASWEAFTAQIVEEIDRLEDMKELEWELQQETTSVVVDERKSRNIDTCRFYVLIS